LDWKQVAAHEHDLLAYATSALSSIEGLRIIGTAREKVGVISFVFEHVHATTWVTISIKKEWRSVPAIIAPCRVMQRFGVPATTGRLLPVQYPRGNRCLVRGIHRALKVFK